jgi:hypothetical protein
MKLLKRMNRNMRSETFEEEFGRTENAASFAYAQSLAADGIFQAGEQWHFIVADFLSPTLGLPPNDFGSIGVGSLSGHSGRATNDGRLEWRAPHTLRFLSSARENFWYQVDSAPPP